MNTILILEYIYFMKISLTPILLVAISVTVLLPLISSGPSSKLFYSQEVRNCDTKMWLNLLYISNYDTTYKQVCYL